MICGYCGKRGHNEANCWKKRDDLQQAKALLAEYDEEVEEYEDQGNDDDEYVMLAHQESFESVDSDDDSTATPDTYTMMHQFDTPEEDWKSGKAWQELAWYMQQDGDNLSLILYAA